MNQDKLRRAVKKLPPIKPSSDFWTQKRIDIRNRIECDDVSQFLTWPSIATTMVPGETEYMQRERAYIGDSEFAFINDFCAYSVHQMYHVLRWEETIEANIHHQRSIIEIGGGFGAMYEVLYHLGWRGLYTIVDFPEMLLLQSYYLESKNIPTDKIQFYTQPYIEQRADLMIAMWSLSEMPMPERYKLLGTIGARHAIFAFQDTWEGQSNREFFEQLGELTFEDTEIPGHRYAFA